MGRPEDMVEAVINGQADAIAMADMLHYNRATIADVRHLARTSGIKVRKYE